MIDPRFFKNKGPISVKEIAEHTKSEIIGNSSVLINNIATLATAKAGDITFLENKKYISDFKSTKESVCIFRPEANTYAPENVALLVNNNPYYAYAEVTHLFFGSSEQTSTLATSAAIHATAKIANASVGEFTVIFENAEIGNNCMIGNNCFIGKGVIIGDNTVIRDNATISHSIIGKNCLLYPGVRIGQDGFGFAPSPTSIKKVLQLGRVIIEDDVEIGANSTIDRGAIGDTVVGAGTKIDNLVQIGHNVKIGKNCFIVSQTGIAGSTEVGNNVMLGGQTGIACHIKIGDNTMIAAQSGVMSDVESKSILGGCPALPIKQWHRITSILKKMSQKN